MLLRAILAILVCAPFLLPQSALAAKNSPNEYFSYFTQEAREAELAAKAKLPSSGGWLSAICCCQSTKEQKCERDAQSLQQKLKVELEKLKNKALDVDSHIDMVKAKGNCPLLSK